MRTKQLTVIAITAARVISACSSDTTAPDQSIDGGDSGSGSEPVSTIEHRLSQVGLDEALTSPLTQDS